MVSLADSLNHRLENRLGNVLIKSGVLTADQLGRALEIQKETLQRLGFILTHYGIISSDCGSGRLVQPFVPINL